MQFTSSILAMALSCSILVTGSAIPIDTSPIGSPLDKRADLETCPGIDNELVRAGRFRVRCNMDTSSNGGREKTVQATDFDDCIGRCEGVANRDWCRFAAFPAQINEPGPCYLKAGNGGSNVEKKGVKLGIRR
ncbi:hypothetical protein CKM354_000974900 [Cercospora kikuchii]|uniref:Apple domain-containing protein n=1 Tax=Cercospora kikuchii TaxID=84275 RepID=A0A9P3CVS2_9PEZI|nr:uncharacterized protein CKM354_000974900 [Cercospora kikuchii]GIZ46630.1 hypothetical protein CKM354_000974900 [Cercospora kikuchii]